MIGKKRLLKYKNICNLLGIKLVILSPNSKRNPSWKLSKSTVYIKDTKNLQYLDSSFCHEIGHVLCCFYGIFPTFHGLNNCSQQQRLKAKLRHGIIVEKYVDKIGSGLMKEFKLSSKQYLYGYSQPWASEWYRDHIKAKINKMEKNK